MLRIVIDGAADIPPEWASKYDIQTLPLHVRFGEETYTPGPGFSKDDFYRLVDEKKIIPKSSLPSIGQIKDFFYTVAKKGDTILSINISSKLSGTCGTVQMAAGELVNDFNIVVFDSMAGSAAQAFMAREARLMDCAGAAMPEIMRRLEWIRQHINIIFTINTLEFAYLSGRINALQKLVVAALNIKPIIVLNEGLLDISDRVRTRKKSIERVLQKLYERIENKPVNLAIVHAADPQSAEALLDQVRSMFNIREFFVAELSIPVAVNLGQGAVGLVAYPVDEEGEK